VALWQGRVAGFLVTRSTGPDEREILNLAVDPAARRLGIARALLEAELASASGAWFLEVRASNGAAQALYVGLGFRISGRRENYSYDPPEPAIVLSFHSCYCHGAQSESDAGSGA
jgi:ribosomal-protein-alanine N-acetyltransferase